MGRIDEYPQKQNDSRENISVSGVIIDSTDTIGFERNATAYEPYSLKSEIEILIENYESESTEDGEPKVAIIIDDFGPALLRRMVKGFVELPFDVTLAILPGNDKTIEVGKAAVEAGKSVFIHLPMQPIDSVCMDERDMVYVDMSTEEISIIFDRIMMELPSAVGVNNHMGSRATGDSSLMAILAEELKKRGLIFVDSRTAPNSCGLRCMRRRGVPALGRDIFLDFTEDPAVIRNQLAKAVRIAEKYGRSVAIGHARLSTLEILQADLPKYAEKGVKFVFVDELTASVTDTAKTI